MDYFLQSHVKNVLTKNENEIHFYSKINEDVLHAIYTQTGNLISSDVVDSILNNHYHQILQASSMLSRAAIQSHPIEIVEETFSIHDHKAQITFKWMDIYMIITKNQLTKETKIESMSTDHLTYFAVSKFFDVELERNIISEVIKKSNKVKLHFLF